LGTSGAVVFSEERLIYCRRRFKTARAALFETAAREIQNFPMRRALKKSSIFRRRLPFAATPPNLSHIGRLGPPPENPKGGM
jgi:hypothetical protein